MKKKENLYSQKYYKRRQEKEKIEGMSLLVSFSFDFFNFRYFFKS